MQVHHVAMFGGLTAARIDLGQVGAEVARPAVAAPETCCMGGDASRRAMLYDWGDGIGELALVDQLP